MSMRSAGHGSRLAVFLVLISSGPELWGQCTSYLFQGSGSGDLIRLSSSNFSSAQLQQAANYWATCPGYGRGFPQFTTNNVSAAVQVSVDYKGGPNTSCGTTTHTTPDQIVILLWDQGLTTTGEPYDCNVVDTLAHELGHALDLANSNCSGYIMGPSPLARTGSGYTAGTRSVSSEECTYANQRWTTTLDMAPGGGGPGTNPPPPCI